MARTRVLSYPEDREGEPHQVAREAVRDLAAAVDVTLEHAVATERQVRNARMTDALEMTDAELAAAYPEVPEPVRSNAEAFPYSFAEATEDAALIARIAGALRTVAELVERLEDNQPEDA